MIFAGDVQNRKIPKPFLPLTFTNYSFTKSATMYDELFYT